jgi:hypothetical protein
VPTPNFGHVYLNRQQHARTHTCLRGSAHAVQYLHRPPLTHSFVFVRGIGVMIRVSFDDRMVRAPFVVGPCATGPCTFRPGMGLRALSDEGATGASQGRTMPYIIE